MLQFYKKIYRVTGEGVLTIKNTRLTREGVKKLEDLLKRESTTIFIPSGVKNGK